MATLATPIARLAGRAAIFHASKRRAWWSVKSRDLQSLWSMGFESSGPGLRLRASKPLEAWPEMPLAWTSSASSAAEGSICKAARDQDGGEE
eukprot:7086715-Alexandrium_andersonii.AAC.1